MTGNHSNEEHHHGHSHAPNNFGQMFPIVAPANTLQLTTKVPELSEYHRFYRETAEELAWFAAGQ
ncbi:MAG: hypothetical protein WAO98_04550 [Alphaproteobacteria bacterium]